MSALYELFFLWYLDDIFLSSGFVCIYILLVCLIFLKTITHISYVVKLSMGRFQGI